MSWRTSPEYETVPRVREPRFYGRIIEFLKNRINDQAGEIRREEFCFLLSISSRPVGCIARLNEDLANSALVTAQKEAFCKDSRIFLK